MSQLTITLSDKADALIAQLQMEIFNRRRKKVSAAGVIETLVESGAKSQSDKRFATSWSNLVADIEKAARVAHAHGAKPANLSDEEWALVLSHRTRAVAPATSSRRSANATSTRPSKATSSEALGSSSETAVPTAVVKRTTKAKSAANPAQTSRKASSTPAKESAKPRATKPKVTKPKASHSKASASQPTSTVAKATPKSTGGSPSSRAPRGSARRANPSSVATRTSEGAAIPATTAAARSRSSRVSAASRMAKAVSRLGATTSPATVAEPPLVPLAVSANGSSPSPAELA